MSCSIVMILHDQVADAARTLASLVDNPPADTDWDLVVVDNASTDETPLLLSALEVDVRVERLERAVSPGAALGRALEGAVPTHYAFLTPGQELGPGWFTPHDGAEITPGHVIVDAAALHAIGGAGAGLADVLVRMRAAGFPVVSSATRASLARNLQTYRSIVASAADLLAQAKTELAAEMATVAADWAWRNHPGILADPELEALLARLSAHVPDEGSAAPSPHQGPRRVVHVLTEAYSIGGHTRLAWRWIAADAASHSEVVLTQHRGPVPPELEVAARSVTRLSPEAGLLERAGRLRAATRDADVVVLHSHPHDVIPSLALSATTTSPAVILLNHAGHTFWIGSGVADVVACLRPSTAELAERRRGIVPARLFQLASPLPDAQRHRTRAEAKSELGIDPAQIVLLTIANPTKYQRGPDGFGFLDLVTDLVVGDPRLVLVAVGPSSADAAWQSASARADGRVMAMGTRQDLGPFHDAADLYLDSFPLASTTSLLETCLLGVPAVSFDPDPTSTVLGTDDVGLTETLTRCRTPDEWAATVAGLADDEGRRLELGTRSAQGVRAAHCMPHWLTRLDELYSTAVHRHRQGGPALPEPTAPVVTALDHRLVELHEASGFACSLEALLAAHAPTMSVTRGEST